MRHLNTGRKLGRNSAHRRAMFRNMVTSLIVNGRVTTTDAKAKELRRYADRMITLGKQQTISARRRARRFVRTNAAIARLFGQVAPVFENRAGGYTRIVKVARRRGDSAPLSIVELTEQPAAPPPRETKGKGTKGKSATQPKAAATEPAEPPKRRSRFSRRPKKAQEE